MKKTRLLNLLILIIFTAFSYSCRQEELKFSTNENGTTEKSGKIKAFVDFEKKLNNKLNARESNDSVENYGIIFSYLLENFLNERPDFVQQFDNYFGMIDTKVTSQTFGDKEKMVFFPIIKNERVTSVLGLKINEERDYVTGVIIKDQDEFSIKIVDEFQNYYTNRQAVQDIEEVVIIVPVGINPFQWWLESGGGYSAGGISGGNFNGGNETYTGGSANTNPNPSNNNQNNNNPCSKITASISNTKFKSKYITLNKPAVFAYGHEMGYAAAYPPLGTLIGTQYPPMENAINTHYLTLPNNDKIFGYMHTHTDSEGAIPIFSPADIKTFLTKCVVNAQNNGNISDAYAMVITSQGTYMLQYNGTSANFGNIAASLSSWNQQYQEMFESLSYEDTMDQSNIEKTFLDFLKNTVNINGLELYKVNVSTNTSSELSLGTNNTVTNTPCPTSTNQQQ